MPGIRSVALFTTVVLIGAAVLSNARAPRPASASVPWRVDSIASPAGPGSAEPNLAVDARGHVYMSWLEPADSGHALKFAVLEGTRWSTPQTIRSGRDFFVNWADFPSIEVLADGRLAAHWLQRTGRTPYAYGIRVVQSSDGGKSWSTPLILHRDTSQNEHGFVAMWREGNGLGAVWLDGRKFQHEGHSTANEMMLLSTTIGSGGERGPEVRLDERTCDCCQNAAALTSFGPIVAYRNRSDQEIRDIYVTRRVNGQWTPGVAVHNDEWKIAACPVNGPSVAASGKRVALAWFTGADDKPIVKMAFSNDAGGKFTRPVRVDGGNPSGRVDVALLGNGDALVTWIERSGGESATVQARRIKRNGRGGAPVTIATSSAARASGFPRMATTGKDVVFAWTVAGRPSVIRVARAAQSDFR